MRWADTLQLKVKDLIEKLAICEDTMGGVMSLKGLIYEFGCNKPFK